MQHINDEIGNLHQNIEATALTVGNLQARMDNITTGDLCKQMLNHLSEVYPNLQANEATITGFRNALHATNIRLGKEEEQSRALQAITDGLSLSVTHQKPAAESPSIRSDLDQCQMDIMKLRSAQLDCVEKAARALVVANTTKEAFKAHRAETLRVTVLSSAVQKHHQMLCEAIEVNSLLRQQIARLAVSSASSRSDATNGSNNKQITASPDAKRQLSIPSDTSNKKRKLANGAASQTNGVGNPARKQRQKGFVGEDDPDEDPDFDPGDEIPQVIISEEED